MEKSNASWANLLQLLVAVESFPAIPVSNGSRSGCLGQFLKGLSFILPANYLSCRAHREPKRDGVAQVDPERQADAVPAVGTLQVVQVDEERHHQGVIHAPHDQRHPDGNAAIFLPEEMRANHDLYDHLEKTRALISVGASRGHLMHEFCL